MLGWSLLKTRRRLVFRIRDPDWLATRFERLVAYCHGYRRFRGGGGGGGGERRSDQTSPLLDDVDEAWTTTYDTVAAAKSKPPPTLATARQRVVVSTVAEECELSERSVAYHQEKLDIILDSICNQCFNHCSSCVYDCQRRYDEPEEVMHVACWEGGEEKEDDEEAYWDNHRALAQVMTASVIVRVDGDDGGEQRHGWRRKTTTTTTTKKKKSVRKKNKMVVGGETVTDPMWPSVLLTFDRGIESSFRELHRPDVHSY